MQGEVVPVAVFQEVVEENGVALARVRLEAQPVRALGEGGLPPRVGVLHVGQIQQQRHETRLGVARNAPIMVRIVLLAYLVVHHLHVLRVAVVQALDLQQVLCSPEQRIGHHGGLAAHPGVAGGARAVLARAAGVLVAHGAGGHLGLCDILDLLALEVTQKVLDQEHARGDEITSSFISTGSRDWHMLLGPRQVQYPCVDTAVNLCPISGAGHMNRLGGLRGPSGPK
eukprot:CAMPEP_0173203516 /NCGR_PEP_ID=MMETSP1141-20130122/19563_1 /TAXON_ID=483371 /ORGANISM="non described non described, Strain CCMP2298" /LENGTH=226 /DNA_ID=CAMNT_0014128983 /DNA_START=191 /DNA_END=872 /DNA_ORIENTATION=-